MIAVYIIVGLIVLFFVLSAIGPKSFTVQRTTVIKTNRSDLYEYLRFLKNQDEWGPWAKRDPNMNHQYTGDDGEVGFVSAWQGNKDVGEGEQEIKKLVPGEAIESHLRFFKPWKSQSDAFIHLKDVESEGTQVTWGIHGKNETAMMRIMGLVMNMDKMVGKDFDEGLSNLKSIMESR